MISYSNMIDDIEISTEYPCNNCEYKSSCNSWDAQYCCKLCKYCKLNDCKNCSKYNEDESIWR